MRRSGMEHGLDNDIPRSIGVWGGWRGSGAGSLWRNRRFFLKKKTWGFGCGVVEASREVEAGCWAVVGLMP
jgi:hypothetical protein